MSQHDVAKLAGVSQPAVLKRMRREGWAKVADQSDLARRAYDRADGESIGVASDIEPQHPASTGPVAGVIVETAVQLRAKVIDRHRKEWDGARNFIYKAIQNQDFDKAKLGKITAEALKIVQDGERKAWGLDKDDEKSQVTVVVKRTED